MASPKIQVHRRSISNSVSKGAPIGEHEFFLEFSITIEEEGCFTIHIEVRDEDDLSGNDWIGETNDALLPCFCFKAGAPRKFFVTGAGAKPTGSIMPPASDGVRLPGITGAWPESDGPFDDTLEVFATLRLYRCASGGCDSEKGCEPVDVGPLAPVTTWTTFRKDVEVANGSGTEEGLKLIEKAVGAGVSIGTGGLSRAPTSDDREPERDVELALAKLRSRLRRDRPRSEGVESAPDVGG